MSRRRACICLVFLSVYNYILFRNSLTNQKTHERITSCIGWLSWLHGRVLANKALCIADPFFRISINESRSLSWVYRRRVSIEICRASPCLTLEAHRFRLSTVLAHCKPTRNRVIAYEFHGGSENHEFCQNFLSVAHRLEVKSVVSAISIIFFREFYDNYQYNPSWHTSPRVTKRSAISAIPKYITLESASGSMRIRDRTLITAIRLIISSREDLCCVQSHRNVPLKISVAFASSTFDQTQDFHSFRIILSRSLRVIKC